ncbi:MAG: twin-arginine translocase TatA/TatE family subunit [Planctomycetaceae bacterium]|nr:twin-arginine translocase TatA/TatE family subunit [Planctomycetaceae bacterium]MBQ2821059.1 twin-arginine translocase TatA/TatE family subunit [Thermoguttaceae bacterium]MDO4424757.1 twin-arginine translocase TatA/TatE family subunit [Planctomycetia bacterium]
MFAFVGIGTTQLLIFGVIALLLFGTRLPAVARSFGQSVQEFKKGLKEVNDDVEAELPSDNKKDAE